MKLIEIKINYNDQPPTYDWIPIEELDQVLEQISLAGLGSEILGPVSWQRQLARMDDDNYL